MAHSGREGVGDEGYDVYVGDVFELVDVGSVSITQFCDLGAALAWFPTMFVMCSNSRVQDSDENRKTAAVRKGQKQYDPRDCLSATRVLRRY